MKELFAISAETLGNEVFPLSLPRPSSFDPVARLGGALLDGATSLTAENGFTAASSSLGPEDDDRTSAPDSGFPPSHFQRGA